MNILVGLVVALIAGVVPMVLYSLLLWWLDRYEKEPIPLSIAAFLWGAVPAIILSLIAQLAFDFSMSSLVSLQGLRFFEAVVVAPVTEEIFKGLALLILMFFFSQEIDSPIDGIIYGGLVGFGFAAVENVLYFSVQALETGLGGVLGLSFLRAFVFGLNHAMFTGLIGLGFSLIVTVRNNLVRFAGPVLGLIAGMVAHGLHNLSVSFADQIWPCFVALASDWGGVFVLLGIIIWTTVRERRWIENHLDDEVERGTLTQEEYEQVSSFVERFKNRSAALVSGDLQRWQKLGRYYRLVTELAFAKRRVEEVRDGSRVRNRINELREKIAKTKEEL